MQTEFEAIIGLEVHCQLATNSKLFCGCRARPEGGKSVADEGTNINTCPICTGHPGTLPVLNRIVVEHAIRAGLALECQVNTKSIFARKNYFYPDLPKGYQISQYDMPICEKGYLDIGTKTSETKRISISRIHIEEDSGKNTHMGAFSLVNFNRAGVPLLEIVSGPDLKTPEEAGNYLRELHSVVTYLGICDGNMQEGNFRCDVNVSVRPVGQNEFGTRVEVKNLNSFRFVEKAIEFEIGRQVELIKSGQSVVLETRTFNTATNETLPMRSKEEAQDYRYFPEPDLVPLVLTEEMIQKIQENLPELPKQKKEKYTLWGLSSYDADVLTRNKSLADFFEQIVHGLVNNDENNEEIRSVAKPVANILAVEVSHLENASGYSVQQSKLTFSHMIELTKLLFNNELSSTSAKLVLATAWATGRSVADIVEKDGLKQLSDPAALDVVVNEVIVKNPEQAAQFKSGKDQLLGYFVGLVMQATNNTANPVMVQKLLINKLKGL